MVVEITDGQSACLPGFEATDHIGRVAAADLVQPGGGQAGGEPLCAEEDELPVELAEVRVRVAGARVDAPLEYGARDVQRAGDDALPAAFVLGAEIDQKSPPRGRLTGFARLEPGRDPALRVGEKLRRRTS